jgi:mannose-1-phosphate guanylyltransferase
MIIPVILSGGSGTRLWPLSRKHYPKQFLSLINDNTLFQDTILRLPKKTTPPLIICNEEHRFIVAEQLRQIASKNKGIILEPIGKNTAPAIAIAAMLSVLDKDDPFLLVLSADHFISDKKSFQNIVKKAVDAAKEDKLVTFGIKPDKPETGYGYIEVAEEDLNESKEIISFIEKPNLENANKYVTSGKHYWNSGIFMFKASVYLKELEKFEPEIYSVCKKTCQSFTKDYDFIRFDNQEFYKCPDKSIDYAIMEKTKMGVVLPYYKKWSDVGSWQALWDIKVKDLNGNVTAGNVLLSKVKNSYIHSSKRLISVNELSNIIVIETEDALLVSSKDNTQSIKKIVQKLVSDNRIEADNHRKVFRPWGYYDSLDLGNCFQVKRIFVNPGAKLSLQKHKHRSEHWVIVKGTALITCGNQVYELNANESTYIPKGKVHRLENQTNKDLEIIEIQTGDYLGEDDIERLEDDYQRK